jgi:hypothetical protein
MDAPLWLLDNARAELEAAVPNKGGHRERAIELVDKAIVQVREGIAFAATHRRRPRTSDAKAGPGVWPSFYLSRRCTPRRCGTWFFIEAGSFCER